MAALARVDWLRSAWLRAALLLGGLGAVIAASIVGVPWWLAIVLAALAGELVASVLYVTTPALYGRVLGIIVGVAAFLLMLLSGAWRWSAVVPLGLAAVALRFRWTGMRAVDAVPRDRTLVPFLFDEGDRLVDALDAVWGSTRAGGPRHGLRAPHSHGSVVSGTWQRDATCDPPPDKVPLFNHHEGTVVARFSNFEGRIRRDDQRRRAHGLALELQAPGEVSFTMVLVDVRRFPVATKEDFLSLTNWSRKVGFGALLGILNLIWTGRTTIPALVRSRPWCRVNSYAERTYHGLNSFYCRFGNEDRVPIRYLVRPDRPATRPVIPPAAVALPRTRLDGELHARLRSGVAVRFVVELVLGRLRNGNNLSDDRVRDPTRRWGNRQRMRLCTITLDRYVPTGATDRLLFHPFNVPEGIEPSDDEILLARRTAYATSYLRRCPLDKVEP